MPVLFMKNIGVEHSKDTPGNVLLFSFLAPINPITTDMLYDLCKDCGPVLRIVIFRNIGVQAMVEFDSVQSAKKAKESLSGDVLPGHCILSIEYAKKSQLKVWRNYQLTWDYTNQSGQQGLNSLNAKTGRDRLAYSKAQRRVNLRASVLLPVHYTLLRHSQKDLLLKNIGNIEKDNKPYFGV